MFSPAQSKLIENTEAGTVMLKFPHCKIHTYRRVIGFSGTVEKQSIQGAYIQLAKPYIVTIPSQKVNQNFVDLVKALMIYRLEISKSLEILQS